MGRLLEWLGWNSALRRIEPGCSIKRVRGRTDNRNRFATTTLQLNLLKMAQIRRSSRRLRRAYVRANGAVSKERPRPTWSERATLEWCNTDPARAAAPSALTHTPPLQLSQSTRYAPFSKTRRRLCESRTLVGRRSEARLGSGLLTTGAKLCRGRPDGIASRPLVLGCGLEFCNERGRAMEARCCAMKLLRNEEGQTIA